MQWCFPPSCFNRYGVFLLSSSLLVPFQGADAGCIRRCPCFQRRRLLISETAKIRLSFSYFILFLFSLKLTNVTTCYSVSSILRVVLRHDMSYGYLFLLFLVLRIPSFIPHKCWHVDSGSSTWKDSSGRLILDLPFLTVACFSTRTSPLVQIINER